jgi:hypothetical protein
MNKVFPRKWTGLIDRRAWHPGPWDKEPEDRVQWSDEATGLPCMLLRTPVGAWAGYVGVEPGHPLYGVDEHELPGHKGVNYHNYTNELHYIAPDPPSEQAIDEEHPEAIIDIIRLPMQLWFFGFDAAHGGDLIPGLDALNFGGIDNRRALSLYERQESYRTAAYMQAQCAELAMALKCWT